MADAYLTKQQQQQNSFITGTQREHCVKVCLDIETGSAALNSILY